MDSLDKMEFFHFEVLYLEVLQIIQKLKLDRTYT